MEERGPFVSVSSGIDENSYESNVLRKIAYVGQSQDKIYWNKEFPSLGLICGSFHETVNSVARWLASAHLAMEHDTTKSPRILVFHTDHHALRPTSCTILDTKHVFGSSRSIVISPNRRPLRLQEQDVSLHHVLALFTPPPGMNSASSSRLMTSIQYVVSQLQTPFDLQAFIQLLEQEKWDEEGSTFVALRQTILTELLSSEESTQVGGMTHRSLRELKRAVIDLSDPILRSTRLDVVLMDMVLHTFLQQSVVNERTLIVLNAAEEYLLPSSPLLHSLESLVSHKMGAISILIVTTNLPALAISPATSNAIDYVAITSPIRTPEWLDTLKGLSLPVETMKSYFPTRSLRNIALVSRESQHLGRSEDGNYWIDWGDSCVSLDLEDIQQTTSKFNLEDPESGEDSEASVGYTSIPEISDTVVARTRDPQDLKDLEQTTLDGMEDEGLLYLPEKTLLKIYDQSSQLGLESSEMKDTVDSKPTIPRTQSLDKGQGSLIPNQNFNTGDDSDSDNSYDGHNHPEMTLNRDSSLPIIRPYFDLASDLPPVAFIVAPVTTNMYPQRYYCLVREILGSSGGYSNIATPRGPLLNTLNPIIKSIKSQGSSSGFKNSNRMLQRAWQDNIVRISMEGSVFLVNPPLIWNTLNQQTTTGSLVNGSNTRIGKLPTDPRSRTISPFLPIVDAVARHGGVRARTPVRLKLVRKDIEAGEITVLGFLKWKDYLREAVRLRLVERLAIPGVKGQGLALQADWTHLRSVLVLLDDPARPAANR